MLTGVNSMVCVQLVLQTEPLGAVLALVGFFSSALSLKSNIFTSFNVTPCAGLTCNENKVWVEGWRCDIVAVRLVIKMWHHSFHGQNEHFWQMERSEVFTSLFMLCCCYSAIFSSLYQQFIKITQNNNENCWLWMQFDGRILKLT